MAIGIPKQTEAFSKKAQEATYLVTEFISLNRKSQTVDENVIRAIYKVTVSKMLQQIQYGELERFHAQTVQEDHYECPATRGQKLHVIP